MKIITTNNNTQVMLATVDSVLAKYGKHGVPENMLGQATLSALKNMFEGKYFNICNIYSLCKQNDVVLEQEHKDFMNTLHCIDFSEMTPELREYLFALCINYFRGNIVMANTHETN